MIKYTIATLDDAEGVKALYEDNKLIMSGDEYHNDIGAMIEGFFFALTHFSVDHECRSVEVMDFDAVYGPGPPDTLEELEDNGKQ